MRTEKKDTSATDAQMLDYLSLLGDHGFEKLTSDLWRIQKDGDTLGAAVIAICLIGAALGFLSKNVNCD
ncbi:hypothetical protein H0A65_09705 [Alcaligenaceae bacterium]|nr:hypothetical protein [Alcaligenaceae bacterium]